MTSHGPRGRFLAAAAQMCSTDELDRNLAVCRDLGAKAAEAGAKLLVLPECFGFLGRRERDKLAFAERLGGPDGPIVGTVRDIARRGKMWVIGGGLAEVPGRAPTVPGDGRDLDRGERPLEATYNACIVVSPDGELASVYRKIHLFDVDIPGRATLRESDSTLAGDELVTSETPLARIGLSVCYDVRFPELYRQLVVHGGAEVLVVPAAFTAHTGAAHWHVLLRARAIENQVYVIAAAQYGQHNEKRASYGHSMIIDPWGTVLAERPDGDGIVLAEIDLDKLGETRKQMPCLDHQVLMR